MKKTIIFLLLAASTLLANAQFHSSCLPEGITFSTQAQVDSFQVHYPGCGEIEGDLTIRDEVSNLNGLSSLVAVRGSVSILNTDSLSSLAGLDSLSYVGGDFKIQDNEALASLGSLSGLIIIGGDLYIHSNPVLTNLSGPGNLTSFWGDLSIQNNDALLSLNGLEGLTTIGSDLVIKNNGVLISLESLMGLTSIGGDLHVSENDALTSLSGLDNISPNSIDNLTIVSNENLSTCDVKFVCCCLALLPDEVVIENNAPGCNSPEEVDEVCLECDFCLLGYNQFTSQEEIDSFQVNYPGCSHVAGDLVINGENITNLNGLSQLSSIKGDLRIGYSSDTLSNPGLEDLSGLENLDSIGGSLWICENDALVTLSGLDGLTFVGGGLSIGHIDENGWMIAGNPALENLSGLGNLTSIGGRLSIFYNDHLNDLTGLDGLTSIGTDIRIMLNDTLTSLAGLDNLDAMSVQNLYIFWNKCLSSCDVLSLCDYLSDPQGQVIIFGNAPGCNNPGEVANECGFLMPCLPYGNYYFSSQSDVDNFPIHYQECSTLKGMVSISGDDITNLDGLSAVSAIEGELRISDNEVLSSLTGLDGLESIGSALIITNNDALINLDGMEGLTSFTGWGISISENDALENLNGLENLDSFQGSLEIVSNNSLTSLVGLEWVTSIIDLFITDNVALVNLTGLENLETCEATLRITNNNSLTSLTGLEGLESIGGDIYIYDNQTLSSCIAQGICDYLSSPPGVVEIYNNAQGCNNPGEVANDCGIPLPCLPYGNYYFTSQAEVDSFAVTYPGCTMLKGKVLISGDEITNLNGLGTITAIEDDMVIRENNVLTSLTGLSGLTFIRGGLDIYGNPSLTSLEGMTGLSSIQGSLTISYNNSLTNLTGLEGVNSLNNFTIENNQSLASLEGLTGVNTIDGRLEIWYNDVLADLSGLENLTSIGDYLWIEGNHQLINLSGLENLTAIQGGGLGIWENDALTSLSGLDNVEGGSIEYLGIFNNPSLASCAVQSICDRLASSHSNVDIYNNAPGCNDPDTVLSACIWPGVEESAVSSQQSAVRVYPNPTSGVSSFGFRVSGSNEHVTLKIYDLHGREVATLVDEVMPAGEHTVSFDVSGFLAGVYFYRLAVGGRRLVNGKMVKY